MFTLTEIGAVFLGILILLLLPDYCEVCDHEENCNDVPDEFC